MNEVGARRESDGKGRRDNRQRKVSDGGLRNRKL